MREWVNLYGECGEFLKLAKFVIYRFKAFLQCCWSQRRQVKHQITGHLDGSGERLRFGWLQEVYRPEEDVASSQGEILFHIINC